jgi:hypothetical protein
MRSLFLSSIGALAMVALSGEAHAMGPIDIEAGARVGYGTNPNLGGGNGPNPLGLGVGARAGVALLGIYGGLGIDYFFGGSQDVSAGGATAQVSEHALKYGAELGYNIGLLDLVAIRPQLGVGNFTLYGSGAVSGAGVSASGSGSRSNLYLEPGVVGLVYLGTMFVGADANVLVLPAFDTGNNQSSTYTAFTVDAQLGVKF